MGLGVWEPAGSRGSEKITAEQLAAFLALAEVIDESVSAPEVEAAGVQDQTGVMSMELDAWEAAGELSDEALVSLIRLFTLIEAQVSGWDAGKTSPVIALVRILKGRDAFSPELRRWIKQHTDNRYLPYGSAL